MQETLNPEIIEKARKIMNQYKSEGFHILGLYESRYTSDPSSQECLDVFYRITPDIWEKYPDASFFRLLNTIEKELQNDLGMPVDLVDADSLAPIGQDDLLSKIHYIDY